MSRLEFCLAIASLLSTLSANVAFANDRNAPNSRGSLEFEWMRLPNLPDREGWASGFSGVSGQQLVFAGGANFPEKRPWEGGKKVWYDDIYVLDSFTARWKSAGKLRHPVAYGISVTWRDSVVCVGGSDEKQHYREAFQIICSGEKVELRDLPPFPIPLANASAAIAGDLLFVIGGQQSPTSIAAEKTLYMINLAITEEGWHRLPDIPGAGRILSVAAVSDSEFYVMSGAQLGVDNTGRVVRNYLSDAWKFNLRDGWTPLPDLPEPVVAGPSPGFVVQGHVLVTGGDNGQQVERSPEQHAGFSNQILLLNSSLNRWQVASHAPAARVTASTAEWKGWNIILSGERSPGIRSPEVWAFRYVSNSLPCAP